MAGYVRRTAVAKGVLGGNRMWMAVAVVIYGRRLLRRVAGRVSETVYCEELAPGETLVISHQPDEVR
jgi:hypothetical protein